MILTLIIGSSIGIISFILGMAVMCNMKNEELEDLENELKEEYSELNDKYIKLIGSHDKLRTEYIQLENKIKEADKFKLKNGLYSFKKPINGV